MIKIRWVLLIFLSLSGISCQTITARPEGGALKRSDTPDYEKSQNFFIGGLVGEAVVPAGQICGERGVDQVQSQTTFLDSLWPWLIGIGGGAVTAGLLSLTEDPAMVMLGAVVGSALSMLIYKPKTAKVWCGEPNKKTEKEESS